jgi:acetyltransferase
MNAHYLSPLFAPRSMVLAGASERVGSLGRIVMENCAASRYKGVLYPLNPKHDTVFGQRCHAMLAELPADEGAPDLLVIASPAHSVAALIRQAGKIGIRHALVISAGFAEAGADGRARQKALQQALADTGIRMIGPNCIGLMRPSLGFNASIANIGARAGGMALVSQSGAVCTALLDWAATTEIGFSSVVSLGGALDIDFGEVLEFLVQDTATQAILLYVEGVRDARGFLSALRAAARVKPVVVYRAGRHAAARRAAASHTGALTGSDAVFDAALARAGTVRVKSSLQLFAAARMLAAGKHPQGGRLAIVTNGGGPGVVAADSVIDCALESGLSLAQLAPATKKQLEDVLPAYASLANPVDVIGDAPPTRFGAVLDAVLGDANVDAVLTLFCPQAITPANDAAAEVMARAATANKPVFTAWLGGASIIGARAAFEKAGVPNFMTPENAVEAFSYLARFRRHQKLLLEAPPAHAFMSAGDATRAVERADAIRKAALADGRTLLDERESKHLLAAFGINAHPGDIATSREAAVALAKKLGHPVAMKVALPAISHKTNVGGVRTNLQNARQVGNAFDDIMERVAAAMPSAVVEGVNVQPMVKFAFQREVLIGIQRDPIFGPVIAFGAGGVAVEAMADVALALPPLNVSLTRAQIEATRIARVLAAYRDVPAIDFDALVDVLLRVSMMACLLPWIEKMDINPLAVHPGGAAVIDTRVVLNHVKEATDPRYRHMAIFPYPVQLETEFGLRDGARLIVRPIRPDDAAREIAFVKSLDDTTRYYRFQHPVKELSPETIARFTQLDYAREMALIAVDPLTDSIAGVARYFPNPDNEGVEFAIAIVGCWQKRGIGNRLMIALIACAKEAGYRYMDGSVLSGNLGMLHLAAQLGFVSEPATTADQTVRVVLALDT